MVRFEKGFLLFESKALLFSAGSETSKRCYRP